MKGPVVLSAGALTGLGRGAAIIFAQEGAHIVVPGRRRLEPIRACEGSEFALTRAKASTQIMVRKLGATFVSRGLHAN